MMLAKREKSKNNVYFQSLIGHSTDSLKILSYYIESNKNVIIGFCEYWGIDTDLFIKNLFIFIYFHDLGKLTKEFQKNISEGKSSSRYPHAYYSFFLLNNINFENLVANIPIELFAVLSHHTQLYSGIYGNYQNFNKPTFLNNEIIKFIDYFITLTKGFENNIFEEIIFDEDFIFKTLSVNKLIIKLIKKTNKFEDKFLLKSLFSYFFSILQLCDDYSSANFSSFIKSYEGFDTIFGSVLINPEDYVLKIDHPQLFVDELFSDKKPYIFQKNLLNNISKFSLLFAPCGRGKTEASLAWALKVLDKFNKNKIIFAMPTQVTSNAMWERLCKIFGIEKVGLFHGKSSIKLKSGLENTDFFDDIPSETFKGNIFFKPITVTTIDHVIYSFVHGFKQSDFALGHLQNSVIIFDEIHYYEKHTLNHLYTLFNFLRNMNIPHILMSGTLPDFIINGLKDYNLIIDEEGLNFSSFSLSYSEDVLIKLKEPYELPEKLCSEISSNYYNNLKQFFIFNTVDRAQTFYFNLKSKFPEFKIILYHSQFTHSDRVKKENEILKLASENIPFILVATQVIEISLDISSEIMFTEIAPPDALGQRGGRLNRKRKNGHFEMKVFEAENNLPYDEELIDKTRKFLKKGDLSYTDFKIWCDNVYDNRTLNKTILTKFFNESVLFGNKPSDVVFNEDVANKLEIRKQDMQKVDVIPLDVYKNQEDNLIIENQVKVPLWWIKNDERNDEGCRFFENAFINVGAKTKSFIICSFDYSYEFGFKKYKKSSFAEVENFL